MPYGRGLCAHSSRLRDNDTPDNWITIEATDLFTKPWQTVVTYKHQPDALFQDNDHEETGIDNIVALRGRLHPGLWQTR